MHASSYSLSDASWLPTLALGLAGAAAVLVPAGAVVRIGLAGGLLLGAALAAWRLRRQAGRFGAAGAEARALADNLHSLCEALLPIWGKQINTGKLETEEAVNALIVRFADLAQRLQRSVDASHGGSGQGGEPCWATSRG